MRTALYILLMVGSLAIAYATVMQTYILLWKPERYAIDDHISRRWKRWERYHFYAVLVGCFIGFGFMIYKGVEGAFWFVPKSWVVENEDGEREWIIHGLAITIAVIASGFVMERLGNLAAERVIRNQSN